MKEPWHKANYVHKKLSVTTRHLATIHPLQMNRQTEGQTHKNHCHKHIVNHSCSASKIRDQHIKKWLVKYAVKYTQCHVRTFTTDSPLSLRQVLVVCWTLIGWRRATLCTTDRTSGPHSCMFAWRMIDLCGPNISWLPCPRCRFHSSNSSSWSGLRWNWL